MLQNRLRILLAERGLNISKVAKDTSITRNTISAIYHNKTTMIRLDVLNKLLKYLNVTPNEFFNYNEMHEPNDLLERWMDK